MDAKKERWIERGLTFAVYAIPLIFLLYVLYWNFLPFGYDKTFTIQVGAPNDTSGEFHLQPSRDLSARMTDASGTPYRILNGMATAVFSPKAVLKNAQITVSVESDPPGSVQIIPPHIDFDPSTVQWDYSWDFTHSTHSTGSTSSPKSSSVQASSGQASPSNSSGQQARATASPLLVGNAFLFDGCEYFDGKSRMQLASSSDVFESGPFTVYAEWKPEDATDNFQEIVGHYNWELIQNPDSVTFQVGRMNDKDGPFYTVTYSIPDLDTFFQNEHTALAVYSPSSGNNNGYIDLYIDNDFAGRTFFGKDIIWADYSEENDLTLGKSAHGAAKYFTGCIFDTRFVNGTQHFDVSSGSFLLLPTDQQRVFISSATSTRATKVEMTIEK